MIWRWCSPALPRSRKTKPLPHRRLCTRMKIARIPHLPIPVLQRLHHFQHYIHLQSKIFRRPPTSKMPSPLSRPPLVTTYNIQPRLDPLHHLPEPPQHHPHQHRQLPTWHCSLHLQIFRLTHSLKPRNSELTVACLSTASAKSRCTVSGCRGSFASYLVQMKKKVNHNEAGKRYWRLGCILI